MPSPQSYIGPGELWRLLFGAVCLRPAIFAEVAIHPNALRLCLACTVIGGSAYGVRLAVASGVSPMLAAVFGILLVLGRVPLDSAIVWLLARPLLRSQVEFGRIVRPLALAVAPAVLYGLLALLEAPASVDLVASLWMLIAFILAVRAALSSGWIATILVAVLLRIANDLLWRATALL